MGSMSDKERREKEKENACDFFILEDEKAPQGSCRYEIEVEKSLSTEKG